MKFNKFLLTSTALAFSFLMADKALAACGTNTGGNNYIVSGAETTQCDLTVSGSTLTIEDSGTIITNTNAVNASGGTGIVINNSGTIRANGTNSNGIFNTGGISIIDNRNGSLVSDGTNFGNEFGAIYNDTTGIIASIDNRGGTIQGTSDSYGILNNGTIGNLNNNGGRIESNSVGIESSGNIAILNRDGTITSARNAISMGADFFLDNTNGVISAVDYSAINLYNLANPISDIINTGGLITTQSNSGFYGTIRINNDLGVARSIIGGTISNTGGGAVLTIDGAQSENLTFDNVKIIAEPGSTAINYNGGTGHLRLVNGTSVAGNIYGAYSNDTSIDLDGTINGDIFFSTGNDSITVDSGSITGNIDFGQGQDTLNINSVFTTGGTITATDELDVTVASGASLTVDHGIVTEDGDLSVLSGGSLFLNAGDIDSDGTFLNAGATRIGVGRALGASDMSSTAGQLVFDARGNGGLLETGQISLMNTGVDLTNQTVSANFLGGRVNVGARSLIASGSLASALPSAALTDNSFLYDFALQNDSGDLYLLLASATSLEDATMTDNNRKAGTVLLDDLGGSGDAVINQIQANLGNASSKKEFNEILEATQPTEDTGDLVAATAMTGAMFDLADGQLAMVNTGGDTGVASGNAMRGLHPWIQAFGGSADQGTRNGVNGYDSKTYGGAFGLDTRNFHDDLILGVSFGYGRTNVDSNNANSTDTDVDSYQILGYSNYDLGDDSFLTGMAAYGWNRNEQTRHDVGGIEGLNAKADYDSWVAAARGSIGHNFRGSGQATGLTITPQFFSEYIHFDSDGYTESGAGGANLSVGDSEQDILNLGLSAQAAYSIKLTDGSILRPDIHASFKHNVLDDDQADTTSSFDAGGSTFSTDGIDPADSTTSIGTGLKLFKTNNWDFTANYDYTFKEDYSAHSGFLRAAYEF